MSDDQDDAQKTEDPTQKRLEETRKKGQVALSREVNNWIMLTAGTVLVAAVAPSMFAALSEHMRYYLEHSYDAPTPPGGIGVLLGNAFWEVLRVLFLPLLGLLVAAIAGPLLQVGPLLAIETIKPDISKISPMQGAKRLFSIKSVVEFAKGVVKIGMVGVICYILIRPYYGQIEHLVGMPIPAVLDELMSIVIRMLIGVLILLAIIAGVDLIFQRQQHMKKIRMTKQEVKDEYKQSEGDPHVKGRLRQLRQERARQRMMQNVPKADVVITNPTHYAIALQYDPEKMDAPICVAKGKDDVALRIREVAKEHDIVLYENKPLARALFDTVDLDEQIPAEQFKAVAEVISYVFRLKGKLN